ncbi:gamma-glutamyl-gamma-aminobutyrate hydrolase family protein [Pseudonocardia eucalypti]|uniref:Gamma-glutamyl-gamma-aminobutyrate hydrolase family protein n=1 Tax=Pseudonocardia eucalypti TaxID=648755 RepID=A0ABP9PR22_9PSEU|nr:putative glutamine amidotransferase [Pseudonocardia eucalypti]
MTRPLIGLTAYHEPAAWTVWRDVPCALLPWDYVTRVVEAGGAPVLLPPVPSAISSVVSRLDGLLLAGGPDIDPERYGAPRAAETQPPRHDRDSAELAALRLAEERGIPVLAICRGAQLLAVSRGGTLHQHLPEHAPARPGHYDPYVVNVAPGSRLAAALGPSVTLSCAHHQGIDKPGTGLQPVAWSPDGTIEAVEDPDAPFTLGIQSHPETTPTTLPLFQSFITATTATTTASRGSRYGESGI